MKKQAKKQTGIKAVKRVVAVKRSKFRKDPRGRKVDPFSQRQLRLLALEAKRAQGIYAGPGRPPKGVIKLVKRGRPAKQQNAKRQTANQK